MVVLFFYRKPDYGKFGTLAGIANAFAPCATLRMFFDVLIPDKKRILYVDTDILFIDAPSKLWAMFEQMHFTNLAGMSEDFSNTITGFYLYPTLQMNSGIMLMNLELMRRNKFSEMAALAYQYMKDHNFLGDQDIYNIIFHQFPEKLYIFPKKWNFQSTMCYLEDIKDFEQKQLLPMSVVHGARGVFHNNGRYGHPFKFLSTIYQNAIKNLALIFAYPYLVPSMLGQNVVYPAIFKTFKDADLNKVMSRSQNLTDIFLQNLDSYKNNLRLLFDPCNSLTPHLIKGFANLTVTE